MVAWITLGQSPVLDSCIDLLHMQLTGTSLPDGLSADQKNEHLKQAFLGRSVLLVLDDCWDISVAKQFTGLTRKQILSLVTTYSLCPIWHFLGKRTCGKHNYMNM